MYQYLACGLDNVLLENGYVVQSVDGEEHVSIDALDSLHMAIGLHLVNTSRSLNGKKIRFLRIEMDMSQKAFGLLLDKSDQAVAKWEKGETAIPRADDACLRNLYLESLNKSSRFTEMLNRLNQIDRGIQSNEVVFAADGDQWDKSA